MYRKNTNSWLKHWDFILLDLIFLQIAYIFSCIVRNGWSAPFQSDIYVTIGIVICFANVCAIYFQESYHGIMRRGYFAEFCNVVKYVTLVAVIEICYLFLSKSQSNF